MENVDKSSADEANAIINDDPVPQISRPGKNTIQLLRGLLDTSNGKWHTSAIVRELNGSDEEALAAYDRRNNVTYSEYMSHLLKRGVVSIGDFSITNHPDIVDKLIVGDRDLLFLGILQATYGRYREFQATCRSCEKDNDITIDLETDFPIEHGKYDLHSTIKVELKNGTEVELNYPTGADSQYTSKKGKTTAEQNTLMIARCTILDKQNSAEAEAWARGLSLADRNKLVKTLFSAQAGPRMEEVDTQCAHCGAKIEIALDWVALLFG